MARIRCKLLGQNNDEQLAKYFGFSLKASGSYSKECSLLAFGDSGTLCNYLWLLLLELLVFFGQQLP